MSNAEFIRSERGFTLQETMVVMIVSSILVGFSYILFQFVLHYMHTNLEKRGRKETCQHLAALLSADIERSSFVRVADSSLALFSSSGDTILYRSGGGGVLRNRETFTPMGSDSWSLRCRSSVDTTETVMPEIDAILSVTWRAGTDSAIVRERCPWSSSGSWVEASSRGSQ